MSSGRSTHLLRGLWALWIWQVVLVAASSKLWEVPGADFSSSNHTAGGGQWAPQCQYRPLQEGVRITADIPPRLEGNWVSTSCEVRPGPEFLTRSYSFHAGRHLLAVQHYYSDAACRDPAYSLVIRAKLRLRQASWVTRGGTEAQHHLQRVGVVVHGAGALRRLRGGGAGGGAGGGGGLPSACGELGRLAPGRVRELYDGRAGRACLEALGFSMAELGLVRVETRHLADDGGGKVQEMFLGDVHTDWAQRTQHRPTGYQQPLQNAMHHVHPCPVCALVFRSSELRPPVLPAALPERPPLSLSGRWASARCETRPSVLFLTRDFTFLPSEHGWEGVYRHFSDPACSSPTFTLRARGHYAQTGAAGKAAAGGTEFVFKVTAVGVTALEVGTATMLNASRPGSCGRSGQWEVGAEQDLGATDGCTALGVKLPHREYELLRAGLDHRRRPLLFVGERPTDGSAPDRPGKRATSYQPPMVPCGGGGEEEEEEEEEEATPPPSYPSARRAHRVRAAAGGADRPTATWAALMALVLIGCWWCRAV